MGKQRSSQPSESREPLSRRLRDLLAANEAVVWPFQDVGQTTRLAILNVTDIAKAADQARKIRLTHARGRPPIRIMALLQSAPDATPLARLVDFVVSADLESLADSLDRYIALMTSQHDHTNEQDEAPYWVEEPDATEQASSSDAQLHSNR